MPGCCAVSSAAPRRSRRSERLHSMVLERRKHVRAPCTRHNLSRGKFCRNSTSPLIYPTSSTALCGRPNDSEFAALDRHMHDLAAKAGLRREALTQNAIRQARELLNNPDPVKQCGGQVMITDFVLNLPTGRSDKSGTLGGLSCCLRLRGRHYQARRRRLRI